MTASKKKFYTMESWMVANGKQGQQFYTIKPDRHITAIATTLGRKVTTERIIAVNPQKPEMPNEKLTRVTLL